ncbi:hypothetical protein CFB44_17035 [Burkholderia sp. AU31280]|nr:hypothetical protein CFB44_17035 [Burkholderia sp. AU31280]
MRCNSTAVTIGVIVVNRMMIAHGRCRMADLKAAFAAARAHDAPAISSDHHASPRSMTTRYSRATPVADAPRPVVLSCTCSPR